MDFSVRFMKKYIIYSLMICICLSIVGCSKDNSKLKKDSNKSSEAQETTDRNVNINLDVDEDETTIETQNINKNKLNILYKDKEYSSGSVKLANYKNLKHNVQKTEVTENDINSLVEGLCYSVATTRYMTSGMASKGDTVNISFLATDENGNEVDKSSENGLKLKLGDYNYYEGLDDGIYGLEVGESNSFTIDYKEDILVEERNIRNHIIKFDVTLNGIYTEDYDSNLQIGTDDFVDTLLYGTTNCRTMEELREYAKKQLEAEALENYNNKVANNLLTQLFDTCEIADYSKELEEAYYNDFWEKCINNARNENITIDKYLELTQQSYSFLDNKFKEKAQNCAKADVILINIAKNEKLNSFEEALQFIIDNSVYDENAYTSNQKEFYDYQYIYF